jgi:hypothetical protein
MEKFVAPSLDSIIQIVQKKFQDGTVNRDRVAVSPHIAYCIAALTNA